MPFSNLPVLFFLNANCFVILSLSRDCLLTHSVNNKLLLLSAFSPLLCLLRKKQRRRGRLSFADVSPIGRVGHFVVECNAPTASVWFDEEEYVRSFLLCCCSLHSFLRFGIYAIIEIIFEDTRSFYGLQWPKRDNV